jgi:hypothetical protein
MESKSSRKNYEIMKLRDVFETRNTTTYWQRGRGKLCPKVCIIIHGLGLRVFWCIILYTGTAMSCFEICLVFPVLIQKYFKKNVFIRIFFYEVLHDETSG